VESSCEFGTEPSGFIKCWETIECRNNWGPLPVVLGFVEMVRNVIGIEIQGVRRKRVHISNIFIRKINTGMKQLLIKIQHPFFAL
jgi:hypothetical protein